MNEPYQKRKMKKGFILMLVMLFLGMSISYAGTLQDVSGFLQFEGVNVCMVDGSSGGLNSSIINNVYYTNGTFANIQNTLDLCDGTNLCKVVIFPNSYTVTSSLIPQSNTIVEAYASEFIRDTNFNTSSNDNLVTLNGTDITWKGGVFDGNNVFSDPSHHYSLMYVSGENIVIEDVEGRNMGGATLGEDGDDSFIEMIGNNIRVDRAYAHDSNATHGFIFTGTNIIVTNSVAENLAQDGFRAYAGAQHVQVSDSQAIATRVGFQAWPTGNRNIYFTNVQSINSTDKGFLIQSSDSACSRCSSYNSSNYSLQVQGSQNVITNFIMNEEDLGIFVDGNHNTIVGVSGEGTASTPYSVNITGNDSYISGVTLYFGGSLIPVVNTGTNNQILTNDLNRLDTDLTVNGEISSGKHTISTTDSTPEHIIQTGAGELNLRLQRTGGTASDWAFYLPTGSTDLRFYSGTDRFKFSSGGELFVGGISGDGTGYGVCIKSDGNLGTCSTAINASGQCTCG